MAVTYERLGDIADISAGGTPSRSNESYWKNGKIPWVKISDIKGKYLEKTEEYITEEGLNHSSTKLFKKGTLLYTIFATIGECTILNIDASTNQAIAGINVKRENVLNEYLYYFLSSIKNIVIKTGRGVAQNNINLTILKNIKVPVPEVEVQKKIINVLNKSNELVIKRKVQIEALDQLTQSVFLEMFGDPNCNTKNHKKVPLGEVFEIKTGGTPSRSNNNYWNGEIPWVKTTEVNENVIIHTEEFITVDGLSNSNAVLFPKDTILIAMYGQGKTRGRTAMLGIEATTNQACAALLPNNEIEQDFMWRQLMFQYDALRTLGRGGNQPNLNLNLVRQFEVILPPVSMQKKFVTIVKDIEKAKSHLLYSMEELKAMYNSLMQRAFRGELFTEEHE